MARTQEPLERLTFNTSRLMLEHPPILRHYNKRIVFQIACPDGCLHGGHLEYSRWPAMTLPGEIEPKVEWDQVLSREDVYDYARVLGNTKGLEWHVNFADPYLFTAYGSSLLAQDEMQVCEHPALGALKEALDAGGHVALTIEQGTPTPISVMGVERRCNVSTDHNEAEGRPGGLYGNAFARAEPDSIRRAVCPIAFPIASNIIAMAAPSRGFGQYDRKTIEHILVTAYTGLRVAVLESQRMQGSSPDVAVHTGFWGCGAFGGHRILMAMLQVMAAKMAGVDFLIMHTFDSIGTQAFSEARNIIETEFPCRESIPTDLLMDYIMTLDFEWGVSDGN